MIRKFTNGLIALSLILFLDSCKDDEVAPPPKTTFTVDKTSGLANDTEFTFVIDKVDAKTISILPYGTEKLTLGGQPVTNFVDGKATVKFKYAQVGTFNAVVVTNNASGDGEFANTYSDPISITITSDRTAFGEVNIEGSTKVEDDENGNFTVTMPYGTNPASLKPKFVASPFSTVTVDGSEVKSGETVVNLTTTKTFVVKSNNGAVTSNYTVTVNVTPVETNQDIKTVTAKLWSKGLADKVVNASVDNIERRIVVYDTLSSADRFDSVKLSYVLSGAFSNMKYKNKRAPQDLALNLIDNEADEVTVTSEDSATVAYEITWASAPKLKLAFNQLTPVVEGVGGNFTIVLTVLKGTTVSALVPTATVTEPAGANVLGITTIRTVDDDTIVAPFLSGITAVNFSGPVTFRMTVLDPEGFTYYVDYNVTVTVVP